MAKSFAPRVAKRERKILDVTERVPSEIWRKSDNKLLKGAQLADIELTKIHVKKQVRTHFDDHSLKELAENIRANGLIQPLVIHREGSTFVLLCGERRFRAMTSINMIEAPCFILENKTEEELMAIQFSENSAREELHFIDKADGIYNYFKATGASERKIQNTLGISKSEVHRSLLLAKLPYGVKEAAKIFNIEKYVLLEFNALDSDLDLKKKIEGEILAGKITKRSQLKKAIQGGGVLIEERAPIRLVEKKKGRKRSVVGAQLTSMTKHKDFGLDNKALERARNFAKETMENLEI